MSVKKKRLDLVIVEKELAKSRRRAQAMIIGGKVFVNNRLADKSGTMVSSDDRIVIRGMDMPYVSRGGLKLEAALKENSISVSKRICLDVGASTGGFTDCLLQNGASIVFAVDVGYGQLAWKLRQDPRVVVIERTNIRHMSPQILTSPIDLVTVDVSFISLKIVVPAIIHLMQQSADILALIKPQFEVGKGKVGKGGVVRDPAMHSEVIRDLKFFFIKNGLICNSVIPSPVLGPKGNREFIVWLKYLHT